MMDRMTKTAFGRNFLRISLFVIGVVTAISWVAAEAQAPQASPTAQEAADVHVPDSSIEHPGDEGVRAHTNHVIINRGRRGGPAVDNGNGLPPGETPGSLSCI